MQGERLLLHTGPLLGVSRRLASMPADMVLQPLSRAVIHFHFLPPLPCGLDGSRISPASKRDPKYCQSAGHDARGESQQTVVGKASICMLYFYR